jgi:hypothetical protein
VKRADRRALMRTPLCTDKHKDTVWASIGCARGSDPSEVQPGDPAGCAAWPPVPWRGLPGVALWPGAAGAPYGLAAALTLTRKPDRVQNVCRSRWPVDVDQCETLPWGCPFLWQGSSSPREFDMSAITKSEMITRRKVISFVGLAAAFGLAAVPTVLAVADAQAQTIGMERRQDRREGRHQRRDDRRTGRTDRREERRTGTAGGAVPAGTTTGSAK